MGINPKLEKALKLQLEAVLSDQIDLMVKNADRRAGQHLRNGATGAALMDAKEACLLGFRNQKKAILLKLKEIVTAHSIQGSKKLDEELFAVAEQIFRLTLPNSVDIMAKRSMRTLDSRQRGQIESCLEQEYKKQLALLHSEIQSFVESLPRKDKSWPIRVFIQLLTILVAVVAFLAAITGILTYLGCDMACIQTLIS